MEDYILGTASSAAAAQFTHIQQQGNQPLVQVFNANAQNQRMLRFAFDGTGSRQSVRPIALDLDGNGISLTTQAQGGSVLADVDDDGFAEQTDWINPRDAILVLDKNADGQISGGTEMFNDAQVNLAARGLNVLQALDANGDNQLTASDYAFSDGKVLQDSQVDKLVQAMAGFAPPPMGQTTLTDPLQTALAPILAANWQ